MIEIPDVMQVADWYWSVFIGVHWGFRKHAAVFWCCTGQVSPEVAAARLGIGTLANPWPESLDVIIFFREYIRDFVPEVDLARAIVDMTPEKERRNVRRIYAGSSAFAQGEGTVRTIAQLMNPTLREGDLPALTRTDDTQENRVPTFRMVYEGMRRTMVLRGPDPPVEEERITTPLLLVSAECKDLVSIVPSLEKDPKNEEDIRVVGTKQDSVWGAMGNAYRNWPAILRSEPESVKRYRAIAAGSDPNHQRMNMLAYDAKNRSGRRVRRIV